MTSFQIKCLAVITMIIDHIGLFFFPQILLLRIIGRLAFPLFAWLIANGAHYTKNINVYIARLFVCAVLSQIPFAAANHFRDPNFNELNVLFTFCIALIIICCIKKNISRISLSFVTAICLIAAQIVHADYGSVGVLSVVAFYIFFSQKKYMVLSQCIIFSIPAISAFLQIHYFLPMSLFFFPSYIEPFAIIALYSILFYNHHQGIKAKYLFYAFYPLQYALIYGAQLFLQYRH